MNVDLLKKLSKDQLILSPFPHYIIRGVFEKDVYSQLDSSGINYIMQKCDGVKDDRGHTKRLLGLDISKSIEVPSIWKKFMENTTSEEFFRAITQHYFSDQMRYLYPRAYQYIKKASVSLRKGDNLDRDGECLTDFQCVQNLPVNDGHTSRTAHLDNPKQIYACLYYMRSRQDTSIGGGWRYTKQKDPHLLHNMGEIGQ